MTAPHRLVAFACLALIVAAVAFVPTWLGFDARAMHGWGLAVQVPGPLIASIACAVAALRGDRDERAAWMLFAAGCALYFVGNSIYALTLAVGARPQFPGVTEAIYFVMALLFSLGMLRFTRLRRRFSTIHVYNFLLIYSAVALATVFLMHGDIAVSAMPDLAGVVALLYAALWLAAAAFGLVSVALYPFGRRSVPYGLLVCSMVIEALTYYVYTSQLVAGTYDDAGDMKLLWVTSSGLVIWAALEQIADRRRAVAPVRKSVRLIPSVRRDRTLAQATMPAIAVGAVLLSAALSGLAGETPFLMLAAILAIIFAAIAGLREHWIITAQKRLRLEAERSRSELAANRRQLAAVLESTTDGLLVVDQNWRVVYWNRHAAETVDRAGELELGASLWQLVPRAAGTAEGEHYRRAMETGQPREFEVFIPERQVWLEVNAFPADEGLSLFYRDISAEKAIRDEIEHLAHHDPLTGLANRTLFLQRLNGAVATGGRVAVLQIDLDHFKDVNDTLGHAEGDALLISVANRLRGRLGETATIGRLGGDEFAVILTGAGDRDGVEAQALELIQDIARPHVISGHAVRVGASIGVAMSSTRPSGPDALLRDADIALYGAKTQTRGAVRFFEPAMQLEMMEKQALRSDLVGAIERGELSLAFQPLVDLRTNMVCSFEALLRWRHPTRGLVSPETFIPIAEETGVISQIGEWALRMACREAVAWPSAISVAVNLSSRQFGTDDLADVVQQVLTETGLPARRLELEITETVLMRDSTTNMATLERLRELGVRIALDDFGTGFSSLGYLQRFPFSKIKIDRAFISGLPDNEESQAIVRSVIGLSKALRLRVTAEGVETAAQLAWVRDGCDEAQGFYLARPVVASDVVRVMAEVNARRPRERLTG